MQSNSVCKNSHDHEFRGSNAFTLLELVLVLTIVATVSSVVAMRYATASVRYRTDVTARQIILDLALARSNENPVYYIQYAHARCASVLRKARETDSGLEVTEGLAHLGYLSEVETLALAVTLGRFPEVVATAAERLEPHDVANYLRDLAADFHSFYNAHKVLEGSPETMKARLALVAATQQVIASGLGLLGVSAPDVM